MSAVGPGGVAHCVRNAMSGACSRIREIVTLVRYTDRAGSFRRPSIRAGRLQAALRCRCCVPSLTRADGTAKLIPSESALSYADRVLTCRDCGQSFVFTAGEQEFHASKGFENDPSRCADCRASRKASRGGGGGAGTAVAVATARGGGYSSGGGGTAVAVVAAVAVRPLGQDDVLGRLLGVRAGGEGAVPAPWRPPGLLLGLLLAPARGIERFVPLTDRPSVTSEAGRAAPGFVLSSHGVSS